MKTKLRGIALLLVLVFCVPFVSAACSKEKMAVPKADEIKFTGIADGTSAKITVSGLEKDLEFSLSGEKKSYTASGTFTCDYETEYTVWVRRAAADKLAASDAITKKFVSIPNPANITAAADDEQYNSIKMTAAAGKDYEYSLNGRTWQSESQLAITDESVATVSVYVRVKAAAGVTGVPLEIKDVAYSQNPDTDNPDDFSLRWSQGMASGFDTISENTDAAGLFGESRENNRSVKMYFSYPAGGIVIRGLGGVAAWSADFKIEFDGYDGPYDMELRYFKTEQETDPTRPAADFRYHGTVKVGVWQNVLFNGDWISLSEQGWQIPAGAKYTLYFDNIVKYSAADLENKNVGDFIVKNSTAYQDYSKLNDALTASMLVGGVEGNMPSAVLADNYSAWNQLNYTQIASQGTGAKMGVKFASPMITDLTDYDGINLGVWLMTKDKGNGTLPVYLAAPNADLTKLNAAENATPLYKFADVVVGDIKEDGDATQKVYYSGIQTLHITKADLTAAGYNVNDLKNLTLVYADKADNVSVIGFRYINVRAYKDLEPSVYGYDFDGAAKTLTIKTPYAFAKELEYTVDGTTWQASPEFSNIGYAAQVNMGVRVKNADAAKTYPNYKKAAMLPDVTQFTASVNEAAYGSTIITAPAGNYEYTIEGTGLWIEETTINDITNPNSNILIRVAASEGYPASDSVSIPCAVKVTETVVKYESGANPNFKGFDLSDGVYTYTQLSEEWAYTNTAFEMWNQDIDENYADADGVQFDIQIKGNWQAVNVNIYIVTPTQLAGYPAGVPAQNDDESVSFAGYTKIFEYISDSAKQTGPEYNDKQTVKISKATLIAAGYSADELESFTVIFNGKPLNGTDNYRITGVKISNIGTYTAD